MVAKNKKIIVSGVALVCLIALLVQIDKTTTTLTKRREKIRFVRGCLRGAKLYNQTLKTGNDLNLGQTYGKCLEGAEKEYGE